MGSWGHTAFENDDAADWAYELEESNDLSVVLRALERISRAPASTFLEAPDCACALAAAEVAAALGGHGPQELPDNVAEWVAERRAEKRSLASLRAPAALALERVRTQSELKQLWDE